MRTSAKMGLRIWNLLLDPYDHEQLADNWAKVDAHDHSPGRGVLVPTEGIALQAVSFPLIASSVFPEVSAEGGELTLTSPEEKELSGGPTIEVPADGIYEIGLQLRVENLTEAPHVQGSVRVNGTPEFALFEAGLGTAGIMLTTNFVRHELKDKDVLSVGVATTSAGHAKFTRARISIWRVG